MHGAAQRVDNREQQSDFFTKVIVGPRTRLITFIQEEIKRMEEKEEAGHRSPTLSILKKSSSAKCDVRKRAPAQIGLNWLRFHWRFMTR